MVSDAGRWATVEALTPEFAGVVEVLARELKLSAATMEGFSLQFGEDGLQLQASGQRAPGPVRVDFVGGPSAHRRQQGGGNGQMIAKAVGIQSGVRPVVLDATAGLGRDAFVLAQLGCQVTLIERHPLIVALLADGLRRAQQDAEVGPIVERMEMRCGNAIELMMAWSGEPPQVIYLDPMFPHRDKSALVKKEMSLFRPLVGDDQDAPDLLAAALALASHRVVLKRPRKAPPVAGTAPGYVLEGKATRFDIYPKRALKGKSAVG